MAVAAARGTDYRSRANGVAQRLPGADCAHLAAQRATQRHGNCLVGGSPTRRTSAVSSGLAQGISGTASVGTTCRAARKYRPRPLRQSVRLSLTTANLVSDAGLAVPLERALSMHRAGAQAFFQRAHLDGNVRTRRSLTVDGTGSEALRGQRTEPASDFVTEAIQVILAAQVRRGTSFAGKRCARRACPTGVRPRALPPAVGGRLALLSVVDRLAAGHVQPGR